MVIEIIPKARSEFNDLATLNIKFRRGNLSTPNRIVNRHDLNAKDKIGADIPLTRISKSFIIQENINHKILNDILNKNGFMSELLIKYLSIVHRLDPTTCIFLYPNLPNELYNFLIENKKYEEFVKFFSDLASLLKLDSIIFPTFNHIEAIIAIIRKKQLQLIPSIKLKNEISIFRKEFEQCIKFGHNDIPLIGLQFATFPYANLSYNMVMDNLDKIHEKNQGIMMLNTLRAIPNHNVSAPHYSTLLTADLVAETFSDKFGRNKNRLQISIEEKIEKIPSKKIRFFCRNDLSTPITNEGILNKINLETELSVFQNDRNLRNFLEDLLYDKIDDNKIWKKNIPRYLSRVHENVQSHDELEILRENIDSNSALDYLNEKKDMNSVLSDHMKERKKIKL